MKRETILMLGLMVAVAAHARAAANSMEGIIKDAATAFRSAEDAANSSRILSPKRGGAIQAPRMGDASREMAAKVEIEKVRFDQNPLLPCANAMPIVTPKGRSYDNYARKRFQIKVERDILNELRGGYASDQMAQQALKIDRLERELVQLRDEAVKQGGLVRDSKVPEGYRNNTVVEDYYVCGPKFH